MRILAAAVAVGFGMLGWLAAHVAMQRLLVHAHADARGGHYHHADGYLAPTAVIAAAMTISALLAVRALVATCAHHRPVAAGSGAFGWWTAAASTAGFLALEAVDTALIGQHPGRSGASFVLAGLAHGMAALGVAALGRVCLRVVVHRVQRPPARPVATDSAPPRPAGAARAARLFLTQYLCAPLGGRAPPVHA